MSTISWLILIILGFLSATFSYTMYQVSERVLRLQSHMKKTGDIEPAPVLIVSGSVALFGLFLMMTRYSNSPSFIFYIGVSIYISAMISAFLVGRGFSRKGFPSKPLTSFQTATGVISCIFPFLLFAFLGKGVVSGAISGPSDFQEIILIFLILAIPSVSGVFGCASFGKLSFQN